ncbi:MAG: SLC13 family permease [Actinomycetia bacterium]|nr:SLC13 family permease [Actinomycetes bacterium]
MSDATLTLVVLAVVVVLFIWNRLPVEIVAIGSALVLYAVGLVTLDDVLGGFGDPTVVLIAALFVVSEGLDATGVTAWVGQSLVSKTAGSARRTLLYAMVISAALTALINLNGSVAALLPVAVLMAIRQGLAPSELLLPMVFAGSAGSLLLLTGSPVNVIVSEAAEGAGVGGFGFAEFALVGVPIVVASLTLMMFVSSRLLPQRDGEGNPPDLSRQASTLVRQYGLEGLVHLRVAAGAPLLGQPRGSDELHQVSGIRLITVLDGRTQRPVSDGQFELDDRLTVLGPTDAVSSFAADRGLAVEAVRSRSEVEGSLIGRDSGAAEVVVPPRAQLVGESVRPGQVMRGGALVVLAVHRQGADRGTDDTVLQAGDVMLVEGSWEALDTGVAESDVLVVDAPDLVRRQAVPLGRRAWSAIAVLGVMVVLLATGLVPAVVAALLAAGAMVILRAVSVQQAYRRISWTTVLLVAGMIPMSVAITTSGAGDLVADLIVGVVGDGGPTMLLVAIFVLTVVFGQLISNTATVLIVIPIAVSAAAQLDVSARPGLMCLLVASAASFLTPIATPANMMVLGAGGYRFGDYWKLGLPMVAIFFVAAVLYVPLIWSF